MYDELMMYVPKQKALPIEESCHLHGSLLASVFENKI